MKKLYARAFDYSGEILRATGFDSEQAGLINIESLPTGDFRVWFWRTEEWVNDEKKASGMTKGMLTGDSEPTTKQEEK